MHTTKMCSPYSLLLVPRCYFLFHLVFFISFMFLSFVIVCGQQTNDTMYIRICPLCAYIAVMPTCLIYCCTLLYQKWKAQLHYNHKWAFAWAFVALWLFFPRKQFYLNFIVIRNTFSLRCLGYLNSPLQCMSVVLYVFFHFITMFFALIKGRKLIVSQQQPCSFCQFFKLCFSLVFCQFSLVSDYCCCCYSFFLFLSCFFSRIRHI